jgi:membrane protein YqaA with SNARE-associated domain
LAELADLPAYGGLFLAAFLAATLLPAQSETVLVGLLLTERYSVIGLLAVASLGNVLGSVVNYGLGQTAVRFRDRRWFPAKPETLERASGWYRKYGRWSLLLSWVPIIGDPLTVAAGVLREPIWSFVILVTLAKTGRYLVLAAATLAWM